MFGAGAADPSQAQDDIQLVIGPETFGTHHFVVPPQDDNFRSTRPELSDLQPSGFRPALWGEWAGDHGLMGASLRLDGADVEVAAAAGAD